MASAGILYITLLVLWVAASAGGGLPLPASAAVGAVVIALAVWAAQRLNVADREGAAPFANVAPALILSVTQAPARWGGALSTAASAIGGRPISPALVRLKLRSTDALGAASVVTAVTGAPGVIALDADAGSLLAHVLVEGGADVAGLQALERAALASAGRAP
jgi:multisubunit Na+/H+ antiporter MnhE subunit